MRSQRAFRPVALRRHLSMALPLRMIKRLRGMGVNRPNGPYINVLQLVLHRTRAVFHYPAQWVHLTPWSKADESSNAERVLVNWDNAKLSEVYPRDWQHHW